MTMVKEGSMLRQACSLLVGVALLVLVIGCAPCLRCGGESMCSHDQQPERWLAPDLESGESSLIYYAARYIATRGGPSVPEPIPTSAAGWEEVARRCLQWIEDLPPERVDELERGFRQWTSIVSPRLDEGVDADAEP